MKIVLHIANILIAFPAFMFYEAIAREKLRRHRFYLGSILLLTLVLGMIGNVIACYHFFGGGFILESVELVLGFLLAYLALHYLKLRKEKKSYELYAEDLLMAKDHVESEVLKLQLHPHFLFNSLNTLHHLIDSANHEARKYVQLLADVYRYILKNRSKELVLLEDELNFSQQYFYLLSIRYGSAIRLKMHVDHHKAEDYLVMPISIQILIENAVKHNHFTVEEPLDVFVTMDNEFITVKNVVREVTSAESLKIGLENLSERSIIVTDRPLIINATAGEFTVKIPLIKYK
jgi:LytS/YehU family sensor histidine kinase